RLSRRLRPSGTLTFSEAAGVAGLFEPAAAPDESRVPEPPASGTDGCEAGGEAASAPGEALDTTSPFEVSGAGATLAESGIVPDDTTSPAVALAEPAADAWYSACAAHPPAIVPARSRQAARTSRRPPVKFRFMLPRDGSCSTHCRRIRMRRGTWSFEVSECY